MKITADWLSDKENVKWLLVVVLSIVLIVVLKHRMSGGKDTVNQAPAPATHNTAQVHRMTVKERSLKRAGENSDSLMSSALKPPSSLKRDIFAFRISKNSSKREEVQKNADLLLNATITDEGEPLAIIGNEVLGIGDSVKGFIVTAISNHEAVLYGEGKSFTLRMIKE